MLYPRGRYLAAKSEADHYLRELKREQEEIIAVPDSGKFNSKLNEFLPLDAYLTVAHRYRRGGGDRGDPVAVWLGASRVRPDGELPAEEPTSLARVHDEVKYYYSARYRLIIC